MNFSVIVPAYNAERCLAKCLVALMNQTMPKDQYEVIVVDDGSIDGTPEIAASFPGVRLVRQENSGPATARNRGAQEASGKVVLFTDSDCMPNEDWISQMAAPFAADPTVVGVKGIYRTKQPQLVARFVQLEYEDKYRLMSQSRYIDFIDTYSAAYNREIFLAFGGFDLNFRQASAEDIDLSYRIGNKGHHMAFNQEAVVYHLHPSQLWDYLRKKYLYAYWRMLAIRKSPNKVVSDSHTPQVMKLQPLLLPAAIITLSVGIWSAPAFWTGAGILAIFFATTVPFALFAVERDWQVAAVVPAMIAGRALAHWWGICRGSLDFIVLRR